MNEEAYGFFMRWRQALLIQLGALEEYLHLPRSVQPKHKRLGKRMTDGVYDIEKPLDGKQVLVHDSDVSYGPLDSTP